MAKPLITLRNTKGSALNYTELDQNFTNLRDSTINFTGDVGDTRSMDLNDATAITGERNIRVTIDEATQSIKIRNTLSDYTTDPNGFDNKSDSLINFNTSTRQFSIQPSSINYNMWNKGQQYTIDSLKTVTIPDTTGIYLVYFDDDILSVVSGAEPVWATQTPVSYVYWNDVSNTGLFTDERHGINMDASTKEYLHETASMAYAEGFQASNYTTAGDGSLNSHAQLDISNGVCYDQDMRVEITHSNTPVINTWQQDLQGPARIPVVYHSGSTGAWTVDAPRDFPLKNGTSLVTYNLNTGGIWTTPDCSTTFFVAYWIVATNFLNTPIIAVMGQRQDNKLSDAIANNTWSSLDLTNFPAEEFRPLYRILVRTASTYANTPKAFFAQVDDYRQSAISPAGSISAVNAFTTISVAGQTDITAESATDALTLVAGTNITLTTDPVTDSVTINSTGGGITDIIQDTTPQLGGNLDTNGFNISSSTLDKSLDLGYTSLNITGGGASNPRLTFLGNALTIEGSGLGAGGNSSINSLYTLSVSAGDALRLSSGDGRVFLGIPGVPSELTTPSGQDLILNTADNVNSGKITIFDGANQNIQLQPNGTGKIDLAGALKTNTTTGTPTNTTTPTSWLKIDVGGTDYYLPLYQ